MPDGTHKLTLEHGGGGVLDLFGVVLERSQPGVIVDSLGVVGRRLGSLRSWDWSIIGEQLATRDPRLVVLQYGTNEADDPDLDLDDARALLRRDDPAHPRRRADGVDPDPRAARHGRARGRAGLRSHESRAADGAGMVPECEWRTPAVLGEIVAVEHAAGAPQQGRVLRHVRRDGRRRSMDGWVHAEPKLAYKDRVHFTDVGYQRWADALSGELLADYDAGDSATCRRAAAAPRADRRAAAGPIAP